MLERRKERHYWQIKKESLGKIKTMDRKVFWNKLILKHKGLPFNFRKGESYNYFKTLSGDDNENEAENE